MKLKELVGAGDKIMLLTLPFVVAGIIANILWPWVFWMNAGTVGLVIGIVLLCLGLPLWLGSVIQILVWVPRRKLITTGPFALMLHPLYTAVGLFVIPGVGLILDTWVCFPIGAALYIASRLFSIDEEKALAREFPKEYPAYRARVLLPWL